MDFIDGRESDRSTYTPSEFNPSGTSGSSSSTNTGSSNTSGGTAGKVPGASDGWSRLSRVIRHGEGTSGDAGYNTMFTGAKFSDTSRHPRQINRSGRLAYPMLLVLISSCLLLGMVQRKRLISQIFHLQAKKLLDAI